jgi:hypothetical protein
MHSMSGRCASGCANDTSLINSDGFLRVDMHDVHEPSRIVRADRYHYKVERAAPRANHCELRVICGITHEVHAQFLQFEREPAP